jgi:hypothetical protein
MINCPNIQLTEFLPKQGPLPGMPMVVVADRNSETNSGRVKGGPYRDPIIGRP